MKKLLLITSYLLLIAGGMAMAQSKSIVVYFSLAGDTYEVGVVEKGNTQIVAEFIAKQTGAELFHVERATEYPAEHSKCIEEARREKNANARPPLKATVDISSYDTVYVGYPNWWGDMPMPMYAFIESQNWNGKTVLPFCTHGGSGLSATEATLRKLCKGATVKKGLAIRGATAQNNQAAMEKAVSEWLGEK